MTVWRRIRVGVATALVFAVIWFAGPSHPSAQQPATTSADDADSTTRAVRGRVFWMAEALERLHGVSTVSEAKEYLLALETKDGQLIPLVEDVRGRSFRRDKRLRGIEVELLVKQIAGSPMVQVIQVFAIKPDGKYEIDYWCEICSIAMFELKACDCCQGDIELRERKVAVPEKGTARSRLAE